MVDEKRTVDVPEGIALDVTANEIKVKGQKTELTRQYPWQYLNIEKQDSKITIAATKNTAKLRAVVGSFVAHVKNMIKGVQEPFIYKLKICSSHFPMTVKVQGNEVHVTNFLGEKKPRKANIQANVTVKVEGDIILIESSDIELAGQTAAKIEQLTKVRKKDRRIFQDGIYMIEKAGKPIL
jgi:large subunit ribosomal protein L6